MTKWDMPQLLIVLAALHSRLLFGHQGALLQRELAVGLVLKLKHCPGL